MHHICVYVCVYVYDLFPQEVENIDSGLFFLYDFEVCYLSIMSLKDIL